MTEVKNKVVLITGANRGIGKAITDAFLQAGAAKVYPAVRTSETAAPLVESYGEKLVPLQLDLADPPSLVADGIINALLNGEAMLFPDSMAKQVGGAYQGFAENVILAEMAEG